MSLDFRVSGLRGNDVLTVIQKVTGTLRHAPASSGSLRLEAGDLVYTRRLLLVR